jgi:peptidoglycan hydrolase CwlO-like protein
MAQNLQKDIKSLQEEIAKRRAGLEQLSQNIRKLRGDAGIYREKCPPHPDKLDPRHRK